MLENENNKRRIKKILKFILGSEDKYCEGFGPSAKSKHYILGLNLAIGKVKKFLGHEGSKILDEINAFDKAEITETHLGQINMMQVSSFCGPTGILWGLDVVPHRKLFTTHDYFKNQKITAIPLYDIQPLLESFKELVGTRNEKHFPFLPGSHVPCAMKNIKMEGPVNLYCSIALGIPKDRERNAILMMEDIGTILVADHFLEKKKKELLINSARSILAIGDNQKVEYEYIFLGIKNKKIKSDEMGCALVASPYFFLARNAVPHQNIHLLGEMSLHSWKETARIKFYDFK